jgi:hypothetical protein
VDTAISNLRGTQVAISNYLANPENRRAPASPAPASERVLRPQICGLTAVKPRRPSASDQLFNAAERYPPVVDAFGLSPADFTLGLL